MGKIIVRGIGGNGSAFEKSSIWQKPPQPVGPIIRRCLSCGRASGSAVSEIVKSVMRRRSVKSRRWASVIRCSRLTLHFW
jgi:hypothetical protein